MSTRIDAIITVKDNNNDIIKTIITELKKEEMFDVKIIKDKIYCNFYPTISSNALESNYHLSADPMDIVKRVFIELNYHLSAEILLYNGNLMREYLFKITKDKIEEKNVKN